MLAVEADDRGFVRIRASGLLHVGDYRRFEPAFAEQIRKRTKPLPLLLDMRGFHGWTPPAFVRDLAWDLRNRKIFSKIAVIGDTRWHKWSTDAARLLFHAELRFFEAGEAQAAEQWLAVAAPTAAS